MIAKYKSISTEAKTILFFFSRWVLTPRSVGAIIPSGKSLATSIAREVNIDKDKIVIELGGGTGNLTTAILATGINPRSLYVLERDLKMVIHLKDKFPMVNIIHADAADLIKIINQYNLTDISGIISGLPLLSLPKNVGKKIIEQCFDAIESGKAEKLLQFTYGKKSPVEQKHLSKYNYQAKVISKIWKNFPPATIWEYRKRKVALT